MADRRKIEINTYNSDRLIRMILGYTRKSKRNGMEGKERWKIHGRKKDVVNTDNTRLSRG
jgi:hypothetical protein